MNKCRYLPMGKSITTLWVSIAIFGAALVHLSIAAGTEGGKDSQQAVTAALNVAEQSIFTGHVTAASGSAQFRDTKTILWQDITLGQSIAEGDHVRTGNDGQIKIEFTNGNILFLKPNSEVTVEKLALDPDSGKNESVFKVIEASLKAEVKDHKNLKTFEIQTPTAVAGVRGTILFVNSKKDFTEVYVEQGKAFLRNTVSDRRQELSDGLATTTDSQGEIAEPFVPPPEKMQEFQGAWEPLPPLLAPQGPNAPPPPPPEGEESTEGTEEGTQLLGPNQNFMYSMLFPQPNEYMLDQQNFYNNLQAAYFDRFFSQQVALTDYFNTTLPGDNDLDGIPDNIDTDDDNDWLLDDEEINNFHTSVFNKDTDNDGLTDWEEARIQKSSPTQADSDFDGIPDINDVFPLNPTLTSNRASIRTQRYNQVAAISGLRSEIVSMLADATERQKDYLMDRISDAQTHKVLKDHSGNWVRTEEYVFRPTPNQVDVQVITYSTSVTTPGWTSMLWSTTFANSLTGMTSTQIRDLPWEKYLVATINHGATNPSNFPSNMNVRFEHQGSTDNYENIRNFASPVFSTSWTQTSTNFVSMNGGAPVSYGISPGSPNTNPYQFTYTGAATAFWSIYVIDDNGNKQGTYTYTDLWSVLGSNLPGFNSVGNNNVEIQVSFNSNNWTVIYVPIRNLTWRGTTDWYEPLSW